MIMKKKLLLFLPLLLMSVAVFTSCEEAAEVGKYDNWRERNEAYIDSLDLIVNGRADRIIAGDKYEGDNGDSVKLSKIPVGELFAVKDGYTGLSRYVYCKKVLADNPEGERPLYTGVVTAYYYGTLIIGERFDGNFVGYTALDKTLSGDKGPTEFDSPASFQVNGVVSGWTAALQYMRAGERWMVYLPWWSGYGTAGQGTILGYSTLVFDIQLTDVE